MLRHWKSQLHYQLYTKNWGNSGRMGNYSHKGSNTRPPPVSATILWCRQVHGALIRLLLLNKQRQLIFGFNYQFLESTNIWLRLTPFLVVKLRYSYIFSLILERERLKKALLELSRNCASCPKAMEFLSVYAEENDKENVAVACQVARWQTSNWGNITFWKNIAKSMTKWKIYILFIND